MTSSRNFVSPQNKYDRVILLVDMDCFFCQVEEKEQPIYRNKPLAVVQFSNWSKNGGIIAVNYAARAKGITRHMRADEAKDLLPEIVLVKVPNIRDKADTTKYRDAGKEVANVLQKFTKQLERASVDEAYLDITETVNQRQKELQTGAFTLQPQELVNTFAVGYDNMGEYVNKITKRFSNPYMDDERFQLVYDQNDLPSVRQSDIRLLIGACIAGEVRAAVKKETGYECSAGVAHNKILAKLAAGLNKPNKQTILPLDEIPGLFETLPVGKIKGLGGKFGEIVCETLSIKFLGELLKFSEGELQRKFDEKNGTWLANICRGIDLECVTPRFYSKSIGCCKKFPGRNNITGLKTLQHWLSELATEITERLEKDAIENNRRAKQMVVQYVQDLDGEEVASSRSNALPNHYDKETLANISLDLIKANTKTFLRAGSDAALNNSIKFLGISVGKFETITNNQNKLQEMFANQMAKKRRISSEEEQKQAQPKEKEMEKEKDANVKPKETEEAKMKSFFANYLQKPKADDQKVAMDVKPKAPVDEPTDTVGIVEKTSFIEGYKQKLKALNAVKEGAAADSSMPSLTSTPPEMKESFFASFLKQQKEDTSKEKSSKMDDSTEMQGLADELDAIEASSQPEPPLTEEELQPSSSTSTKRKFEQLETCNNYKESYAEYATPELRTDLVIPLIKCDDCGAQLPNDPKTLQSHRDHHFAQELSRQLRAEQREEREKNRPKAKQSPTAPTPQSKQKAKKSTATAVVNGNASITKFLAPANAAVAPPPPPANSEFPMQQCDECKTYIKCVDMPEHLDYHMAKKLQRELNQQDMQANRPTPSPGAVKKQSSNKLNATLPSASASSKGNRTIAQFFSQIN
ncbi:uncharacterized protein Dwil_GK12166 [Drosophila willistoni]|uniref:DNA polymerase eta n=1 Tax=Drosophila willistoni TaxID=7260 RepID=B4N4G7_DROWI|nr:DNApol-eta [Drosophila willistoni]EDW79041.1 uncharacterized protein Dwil_GK12166 [Drosophila willistoni]